MRNPFARGGHPHPALPPLGSSGEYGGRVPEPDAVAAGGGELRSSGSWRRGDGVPPVPASAVRSGDRSLLYATSRPPAGGGARALSPSAQLALPTIAGAANYVAAKLEQAKPMVVREFSTGERLDDEHPALVLWENANADFNGSDMTKAAGISAWLFERAYIRIYLDRMTGMPYALRPWPVQYVQPHHVKGSGRTTDWYALTTDSGDVRIPREEMIEIRFGVDPLDPTRGFDTLRTTGTDAYALQSAARATAALLSNMGMTSGFMIPEGEMSSDELNETREALSEIRVDGSRAGELQVLNQKAQVVQMGFEPQKLAMEEQVVLAESHIFEAMRIHPSVEYSLAGLKYDNTRGGRQESRKESFTELIIPLWETISDALTRQLLPYWPSLRGERRWRYDYSHIDELVAGDSERFERWGRLYERGGCTLNEMRTGVGLPRSEQDGADDIREPARIAAERGASDAREL